MKHCKHICLFCPYRLECKQDRECEAKSDNNSWLPTPDETAEPLGPDYEQLSLFTGE